MLGVRLPQELDKRLSKLALQTKRPKSFYVKEALSEYLDEYESTYKAICEYENAKKSGSLKTLSLEELMQKHKLTSNDVDA